MLCVADTLNHEPHVPSSPDSVTSSGGGGRASRKQQQPGADSEADDGTGSGKSLKSKLKVLGSMNGGGTVKKAILRKSTKNLLRK
jgi:hypothetical protein